MLNWCYHHCNAPFVCLPQSHTLSRSTTSASAAPLRRSSSTTPTMRSATRTAARWTSPSRLWPSRVSQRKSSVSQATRLWKTRCLIIRTTRKSSTLDPSLRDEEAFEALLALPPCLVPLSRCLSSALPSNSSHVYCICCSSSLLLTPCLPNPELRYQYVLHFSCLTCSALLVCCSAALMSSSPTSCTCCH